MHNCASKRLLVLLLVLMLGVSPALAQDDSEAQQGRLQAQLKDPDGENPDAEALKEQKDKNEDVREAVLENLDLKELVEESADDSEDSATPGSVEPSQEEGEPSPAEIEAEWYDRFKPIANKMQEIPYLSDRGWLHFARVELEYGNFSKSELLEGDSGFSFRSLRSGVIKLFGNGTIVKLDIDLTDGDSNFTDMYVRLSTKLGLFTLGNQKVALSLVNQTSRLARTFMEEPLPAEAFGLVRRLGVGWDFHRKKVGVHLTAFGPDLNERVGG